MGHAHDADTCVLASAGPRQPPQGAVDRLSADFHAASSTLGLAAAGIRQNLDAVTAGLTLPYSSGTVEGNVNRRKAIKRQMYGRVGLELLPKRVICHSA